jgi:hypothetical protein
MNLNTDIADLATDAHLEEPSTSLRQLPPGTGGFMSYN